MRNLISYIIDVNLANCKRESRHSAMDLYRKIENL